MGSDRIPGRGQPTESDAAPPYDRHRKHLRGLGAFRPFPTWFSLFLAIAVVAFFVWLLG
jgi:hypothetical protein